MDSDGDLDLSNLGALIALWQEEESRLNAILANDTTSPEVKRQVEDRLSWVQMQIGSHKDELQLLESGANLPQTNLMKTASDA